MELIDHMREIVFIVIYLEILQILVMTTTTTVVRGWNARNDCPSQARSHDCLLRVESKFFTEPFRYEKEKAGMSHHLAGWH